MLHALCASVWVCGERGRGLLTCVLAHPHSKTHSPSLSLLSAVTAPKTVTVAVTSDKGLCGGLNSNIAKYTRMMLKMNGETAGGCLCLRHQQSVSLWH